MTLRNYKEKNNHDDGNDISNIFKKKKVFKKFIHESGFLKSTTIRNLNIFVFFFILIACIMCIINYIVGSQELDENS